MPPTPQSPSRQDSLPIRRAGVIGILGRPNVGKSTLLNQIVGEKLSIATPRPQTTRSRLLAVTQVGEAQLALVDTPGLHRLDSPGRTALNAFMVDEALSALSEVDLVLLLTDPRGLLPEATVEGAGEGEAPAATVGGAGEGVAPADRFVAERVVRCGKPVVVAINKVDLVTDKRQLLPLIEAWSRVERVAAVVPISALSGDGVDRLLGELCALLPEGPALYPPDMLTDRAERWLAAEFIREQVFLATRQEIPYAVAVTVDDWQERQAGKGRRAHVAIHATIHVEKPAQKKIVVGARGQMIRQIGTAARAEIAALLGCPVHLELFVRVDPDWSHRPAGLREMGYHRDA